MSSRRLFSHEATFVVILLLLLPLDAQQRPAWKDPSRHTLRFIGVDKDVRLEVLDWGGSGRSLVLLAGGGDTAHVFDGFATQLTAAFHVYGITRRGFGQSELSATKPAPDRLADDVLAVMDSLKLQRPMLVGHSIAGAEMSSIATRYPSRVSALVYIEAAYPYAFQTSETPTMKEFQDINGPQPPPPSDSDLKDFDALRQYYLRVLGFTYPEAELRQQRNITSDGRVGRPRDFPGYAILLSNMQAYGNIPAPSLVIFGEPHGQGRWVDSSIDPKVREAASSYDARLTSLTERQASAIETAVPTARVVRLHGAHHYVYLSNQTEVVREIRSFAASLKPR
jgi:non-heme chloroperoxidase